MGREIKNEKNSIQTTDVAEKGIKQRKLLGFRSNRTWKKVLSIIYLVYVGLWLLLSLSVYNSLSNALVAIEITLLLIAPYIFLSNFKLRSFMPLFKKRHKGFTFLGMVCVYTIILVSFSIIISAVSCDHEWEAVETKAATCTQSGSITYVCNLCGANDYQTLNEEGHSFEVEEDNEIEIIKVCAVCGEKVVEEKETEQTPTESTEKLPITDDKETTPVTTQQTENPTEKQTEKATDKPTESQHKHTYKAATCTQPKICTECGETTGEKSGHKWKSATCTAPKICSVCDKTSGSAKGHSFSNGYCTICDKKDPNYVSEVMVWIPTNGGTKYHSSSGCSNMDNPNYVTKSTAEANGFTPCKRCY